MIRLAVLGAVAYAAVGYRFASAVVVTCRAYGFGEPHRGVAIAAGALWPVAAAVGLWKKGTGRYA